MNLRKIRKQIHYHSAQRWGVTVVLMIILFVMLLSRYSSWNHVKSEYDCDEHLYILTSLQSRALEKTKKSKEDKKLKSNINPKIFDPNTISIEELINMGIKESVAKSWTKYTAKGGKFHKQEDLKKLYVMNDFLYEKLKPFIVIKEKKKSTIEYTKKKKWVDTDRKYNSKESHSKEYNVKDSISEIERMEYNTQFNAKRKSKGSGLAEDYVIAINSTDSTELKILDGIGPVLSSRIIKYRDQLGGFHNMNQLLEVYGVKTSLLSNIMNKISFEGSLKKIDLNNITLDSLVRHPYFDYATANIFINYRSHHGPYKDINDVKKIIAIKEYWLEEVAPYFDYSVDE